MADSKKPASLADIVSSATRAERTARVCVAGHLNDAYAGFEHELLQLTQQVGQSDSLDDGPDRKRRAVAERMEQLRAEMQRHEHGFTFTALAPKEWSDLTAAHAPRDGKREAFNVDTFPLAACLATLRKVNGQPVGEGDSQLFEQLWSEVLNEGQRGELFNAAWEANTGRVSVPFSALASATLTATAEK